MSKENDKGANGVAPSTPSAAPQAHGTECDPGLAGLVLTEGVGSADQMPDVLDESNEVMQWGFVPLYRKFKDESWWTERPWDRAHFFLDLFMRARRTPCKSRSGTIARGEVVSAYTSLALQSGRDVKTIRRWCKDFTNLGEIEVRSMGRNGIVIRLCKYESYALKDGRNGSGDGAKRGGGMG